MSTSPELLIAHAAAKTKRIRIGSGGIMLPNHSPLKLAENFSLLEALHPGRIDLGIGRAPGTDFMTALALRRSREAVKADQFPEQLQELLWFFFTAHISPHLAIPMLREYRENFKPSRFRAEPKSALSLIVIAADTDEEAHYHACSRRAAMGMVADGSLSS